MFFFTITSTHDIQPRETLFPSSQGRRQLLGLLDEGDSRLGISDEVLLRGFLSFPSASYAGFRNVDYRF